MPEGPCFLGLETVLRDLYKTTQRIDPCLARGLAVGNLIRSVDGTAENWATVAWYLAPLLLQDIALVFWRKGLRNKLPA